MQAGARFGDILEQKLANRAGTWPMAAGPQFDPRVPVVNPLFLQVGAVPTFSADVARSTACFIYAVQGLPSAPRQPRPRRRLSAGQRGALDCLRELGAGSLPDDFTDAEIRRAFRLLARRFHPDRHPWADDSELSRLSREFDRLTRAYRQLTLNA